MYIASLTECLAQSLFAVTLNFGLRRIFPPLTQQHILVFPPPSLPASFFLAAKSRKRGDENQVI